MRVIEEQHRRDGATGKQLRECSRKRDFPATKGPAPSTSRWSAQGSRRRFVIQEHDSIPPRASKV